MKANRGNDEGSGIALGIIIYLIVLVVLWHSYVGND